jgi:hypothetical protein
MSSGEGETKGAKPRFKTLFLDENVQTEPVSIQIRAFSRL